MNIAEIAYAAGLIDGEGTITLTRQRRTEMRSPTVSISSTTYPLLEFMKLTFGGHIVTLSRNVRQGHKQAWHWCVTHNKAIFVIEMVLPYLKEPEKVRRATLILDRYKQVTAPNGKYTDELLQARRLFEDDFFVNSDKA